MSDRSSEPGLQSLALLPRYLAPSGWWQHVPLAHWLIGQLRPAKVVELGTHYGVSLFSFCEAAEALKTDTFVYGIDTWEGDEHAGHYNDDVFLRVQAEASQSHLARCRLVRSRFDEAVPHFADSSIDLLHIDGLHTYDAVKHDYLTWRPKVSERGVILFHDINVRERDFGVWRLWDELKAEFGPNALGLPHGHGLGILSTEPVMPAWFDELKRLLPVLAAKGALLSQLADLRPQSVHGASDMLPYRLQAERTWRELVQCQQENERLREGVRRD